ncbi:dynein regulatory complex protein 10 [Eublepharis macularius]|uniref:Dynein regulatory complex protein 10 n=1 Tax=Eublepharis macularius TaxID=481883 RepID=A0AA97LIB3_EUBMA|nr:dynein regulatory complex protein 10 [Eublepharis macularius]XP_054852992.1 dynein regulatory complex protein 10 [Eublepharis macularius]XP_054852993.1 dynein regulatory complex protein 10 [Eublepharis macularius]
MATQVLSSSFDAMEQSSKSRSPVNLSSQKMTVKTPLKILDPGRAKLTTVETKRIISVLDDTILKVELVTMFLHVMENLEDFSTALGPELSEAFKEHLQLSNAMKATLAQVEEEGLLLKGIAKGELFAAADQSGQLQPHIKGLKSSVRNIVRLFYMNPIACRAVRDAAFARSPTADVLLRGLEGLRRFLFEMLLITPLEEKEKMRFMQEIALRDKKNMEAIAALEAELASAIHNRNEEISKQNACIKDLKTHLHNLSKISENQIQRTRTEAEKQQKGELRGSQAKCAKTLQEIQQLRAQLNALVAENRESEFALRKKKYKVEIEIENWVQKYDMEMIEKQAELEEINVVYTVEKAQLEELREKFDVLDEEFCQIQEERQQKQEQREKAEKELAILVRAATLIQALWKGYLVRSLLRSKRRKKGKGKKAKK